AAPAQVVHAGVDHQAGGAPHLVGQAAEVLVGGLVDAHFLAQLLHVQAPALAVGRDVAVAAEVGLFVLFAGERGLEGVAGGGFVQGQGGEVVKRARGQVIRVHPVGAQAAAAGGPERGDVVGHRDDGEAPARQRVEVAADHPVHALGDPGGVVEQVLGRVGVELRVGAQKVQEGVEVALEAGLGDHLVHFGADAGHFGQADVVDFLRREVKGGVFA